MSHILFTKHRPETSQFKHSLEFVTQLEQKAVSKVSQFSNIRQPFKLGLKVAKLQYS